MDNNEKKGISRRSFLMGIPVGIAGVVAFNAIGNRGDEAQRLTIS